MATQEQHERSVIIDRVDRICVAVERIAAALDVLAANLSIVPEPEPPAPICSHPFTEIVFVGTNSEPRWQCACGAEVSEVDYTAKAVAR